MTLMVSCGPSGTATVDVLAASSLTDAFEILAERFEAVRPGVEVRLQFAASSAHATLIADGGPGDVFASADERTMARVVEAGRVDGPVRVFATNRLTLVVAPGNPLGIAGLADLEREPLLVGRCAPQVPCGALADAVLSEAGVDAAADSLEPNVRSLLNKVALGELDVGLVYVTDARAAGDAVDEVAVGTTAVNRYGIAVLADADPGTDAFVEFVLSEEGRSVLGELGFGAP